MNIKKSEIIILAIVIVSFIVGIYFYPQISEKMASHWNFRGEVDSYMSKFWGLFLIPLVLLGLALFFLVIPRIDPLKENIEKFRKYYNGFIVLVFIFMFTLYIQVILWNLGIKISLNATFPIGFGLLFFYAGILCENAKRNWFIGIRTPWTLSSETVWEKTHKISGKLFKISGVIAIVGVLFRNYALFFILVPSILAAVYAIIYSYFEYRKETK
jgi:uncharacterized membrane protein